MELSKNNCLKTLFGVLGFGFEILLCHRYSGSSHFNLSETRISHKKTGLKSTIDNFDLKWTMIMWVHNNVSTTKRETYYYEMPRLNLVHCNHWDMDISDLHIYRNPDELIFQTSIGSKDFWKSQE